MDPRAESDDLERSLAAAGVDFERVVGDLRHRRTLDLPTEAPVLEAAAIKARRTLAYAGSFAIATAVARHARLLTGDPEILDNGDPAWRLVEPSFVGRTARS